MLTRVFAVKRKQERGIQAFSFVINIETLKAHLNWSEMYPEPTCFEWPKIPYFFFQTESAFADERSADVSVDGVIEAE